MVEEGEQFAEMDKKIKEVAEAKTSLERVAYTIKASKFHGGILFLSVMSRNMSFKSILSVAVVWF